MKGCLSSSSKAATRRCLVMSGSQATSTKMQPSRSAFVTNAHPSSFWYFLIRSPLFFSFHSLYLIFLSFSSCLPSCRKNMQFSRWRKQILNCRQQQENPVWVHLSPFQPSRPDRKHKSPRTLCKPTWIWGMVQSSCLVLIFPRQVNGQRDS